MNKDTIKGKAKDAAGRVERQVGEWTDREDLQAEGAARQVEGKVQKGVGKVVGKVKEMTRDAMDRAHRDREHEEIRKEQEGTQVGLDYSFHSRAPGSYRALFLLALFQLPLFQLLAQ
jgi:uncharacterized protein YjbJ (UPF0337 family)